MKELVSLLRSHILRSWPGIEGKPSPRYQSLHENMQNIITFLWRLLYWLVFRKRSCSFIMAWKFLISWPVASFLSRVVKLKCICPLSSWSWALQLCDRESPDHPLTLSCTDWRQFKQYCCFVLTKIKLGSFFCFAHIVHQLDSHGVIIILLHQAETKLLWLGTSLCFTSMKQTRPAFAEKHTEGIKEWEP